jgi:toxin ParE1/3/4
VKQYAVSLSDDAKTDLQDIYDYIAEHGAPAKADGVLGKLETLVESLRQFPERGAVTRVT